MSIRTVIAMTAAFDPTARRRSTKIVALSWAVMAMISLAIVGCSGDDGDSANASAGNEPAQDRPSSATEPSTGGAGALALGECPVTDDDVSNAVGSEMPADGDCRWFDGVVTVEVHVQGGGQSIDDEGKAFFAKQGYEIKDLDRGDRAFLGIREVEAHAEVGVGDAAMKIEISGLEGADRFESIALALIDAALA